MGMCKLCGKESEYVSSFLGLCSQCIIRRPEESLSRVTDIHREARKRFNLTLAIPKKGVRCVGCGNECRIPEGEKGYCGLVENKGGELIRLAGTEERGLCEWYYDELPTNCVASWVCPAGTGCGYPRFATRRGPEYEYLNLSVFYGSCNFDCLFCQNWHFKYNTQSLTPLISAEELASKVNEKVKCICYFGGNPDPQLPHAIRTSEIAMENTDGILRICMETNGNANPSLLKKFAKIALESGGCVKFDLKTFDEGLNIVLCGISNKTTLKNFKMLSRYHKKRPEVPFLHASTLLIPGYVEVDQVKKISKFITKLDNTIPYTLLAFHPMFLMDDLPFTSRETAERCLRIAREQGLERVRIGNVHLLR